MEGWEPQDSIGQLGNQFDSFVEGDTFNLDKLAEIVQDYIGKMEGTQAMVLKSALVTAGLGFNPQEKRNKFIVKTMKALYDELKGVYTGDIENITYSELCTILSTKGSKLLNAISEKIKVEITETDAVDLDSRILSEIPSEDEEELSRFFPLILYLLWAMKGEGEPYSKHSGLLNGGGKSKRRKRSRKRNSKRSKRRSKTKYKKKTRRSKKKY